MKKKSRFSPRLIAFVLFTSGLVILLSMGFLGGQVALLSVANAVGQEQPDNLTARLVGVVSSTNLKIDPNASPNLVFLLEDQKNKNITIPVSFHGTIPPAFKEETKVFVEGKLHSNKTFTAVSIQTVCPSKYESQEL